MRVVTDSGADLMPEEITSMGIEVTPLLIQFPEGEVAASDLSADEFYDRLEAMRPDIPTTAQPAPGAFADVYRQMAKDGDEIVSVHISSGLSGTIQSARVGAEQAPEAKVTFIDSLTLSGGQRFQTLAAALGAKAGWSAEKIAERAEKIRVETEVIYTLETLEYLARGGRIGRVQALASSIFSIKPVIHVSREDGKYSTVGKARTLRKTKAMMAAHLLEMYGADEPLWVSVVHGRLADEAEQFTELLRDTLNVTKPEMLRISPVLGVHTGPGIVGATVVPIRLFDGLI